MTIPDNGVSANGVGNISDERLNTFVQGCTTATKLRAFIGLQGMTVELQGITAPNDGNSGVFYWSFGSYTDDNLNVIVPSGAVGIGAWLRLSPVSSLTVTDGSTTIDNVGEISFTAGAIVTSGGAGVANVDVSLRAISPGNAIANTTGVSAVPIAVPVNQLIVVAAQNVPASTATITPGVYAQVNVALSSSTTLTIANGSVDGQPLTLRLAQPPGGNCTVAFSSSVLFGADITSFTASTAGNAVDFVGLRWDATFVKWCLLAVQHGF